MAPKKSASRRISTLIGPFTQDPCAALRIGHPQVEELARHGDRAVIAALKAMQGPAPPGQHPRDMVEALGGVLQAIAKRDAAPLIQVLERDGAPADPQLLMLVSALGFGRKAQVLEPLIRALKHRNPLVRWSAAGSLIQLRTKKAVGPLTAALSDRSPMVYGEVIEAMRVSKFYRNADAIAPLQRVVQRPRVRKNWPGLWRSAQAVLAKLESMR